MSVSLHGGRAANMNSIVDVIVIAADVRRLIQESKAFRRATTPDAELGEGDIVI